MNVVYVGPFDEVFVPDVNAPIGAVVKRGETVSVDDDLGASLLAQPSNWAKPGTKAASLSKAAAEDSGTAGGEREAPEG